MEQPNKDYMIQSYQMQLSESAYKVAERDAILTEKHQRIQELEKELEEVRQEQIKEMDKSNAKK